MTVFFIILDKHWVNLARLKHNYFFLEKPEICRFKKSCKVPEELRLHGNALEHKGFTNQNLKYFIQFKSQFSLPFLNSCS